MPSIEQLNTIGKGMLPGLLGIEITNVDGPKLTSQLVLRPELMAPNGYLHAATIVALADTTCGYGTIANAPENAQGFTTIELKTNFLGTARDGIITCEATQVHGGRTTQVWDARVVHEETKRALALFRCTQLILYPRS